MYKFKELVSKKKILLICFTCFDHSVETTLSCNIQLIEFLKLLFGPLHHQATH